MKRLTIFQSTHPRGVRHPADFWPMPWDAFQSTHPRGVRPMLASPLSVTMAFQSTHPRGVRLVKSRHAVRQILISIHAPTWGATGLQSERHCSYGISIHAPTWGATVADGIIPHRTIFQSTHPRGVRHYTTRLKKDSTSISIHAPTWGATP